MKNIRQIFQNNVHLMDEPEVIELIDYCKVLEDKIIESTQSEVFDKEIELTELIRDIYKGCLDVENQEEKWNRWPQEFSKPNYEIVIDNLKRYILNFARDNKFRL